MSDLPSSILIAHYGLDLPDAPAEAKAVVRKLQKDEAKAALVLRARIERGGPLEESTAPLADRRACFLAGHYGRPLPAPEAN